MIWLALYTNPSAEWAVCQRLKPLETLFLHYQDTARHARRERAVIRPYFPRYIFVRVDPSQGLYGVAKTIGVHSIVGGVEPQEIPADVIEELRSRGDDNGLCVLSDKEKKVRKRLLKGDKVRIAHGSLTGLLGTVIFDAGPSVKLWVERMKVFVHPEQLSPAGRRYTA